jgi:2-keto-4-pentenoate hydratase
VQDRLTAALGGTPAGWRVLAASNVVQRRLALSGPIAGSLVRPHVHPSGVELASRSWVGAGWVQAGIGLRLGHELRDGPFTALAVADAVVEVVPVVELVDFRYEDPAAVGAPSLIADGSGAGEVVVGPGRPLSGDRGPHDLVVRLVLDGRVVDEGMGSDVLGGPLHVLAWLAGHLAARGRHLDAGDLVATGGCTGIVPLGTAGTLATEVAGLGGAEMTIGAGATGSRPG